MGTDGRDVAAKFGKMHKNVLQAIQNLECSSEFRRLNFQPFKINDLTGESTSHIEMTEEGGRLKLKTALGKRCHFSTMRRNGT